MRPGSRSLLPCPSPAGMSQWSRMRSWSAPGARPSRPRWSMCAGPFCRAFSFSCLVGKTHHVESFAEMGIVAA